MTERADNMNAYFSHGRTRNGQGIEWWWVNGTLVRIEFDAEWFSREGSIDDLKQIAIAKALET